MRVTIIGWLCVLTIYVLLFLMASCNSQKHIQQTSVSFDSTFLKSEIDSVRVLKSENERLYQQINEMQYAGVSFDTIFVQGKNDTVTNTVTITKEGDITAKGKILSAYVSKSVLTKIVNEKQQMIDSLSTALSAEKKNVKVETQIKTVDKIVKTPFPWLWIAVMFVVGGFVWDKSKPFFLKLLKL